MKTRISTSVHPFLRVVTKRNPNPKQRQSMRKSLQEVCDKKGIEPVRIISETFESIVAEGVWDDQMIYIKTFHALGKFESEISGLYYLREGNVPQIIDFDRSHLAIMTRKINGDHISGSESLDLIFYFLGRVHSIGCAAIEREDIKACHLDPSLENYHSWQREMQLDCQNCFSIGDNHFSNFLLAHSGELYRVDLASFALNVPCCVDVLSTLWMASDQNILPRNPANLIDKYVEGAQSSGLKTRHNTAFDLISELDILSSIFDKKANTFVEHYDNVLAAQLSISEIDSNFN